MQYNFHKHGFLLNGNTVDGLFVKVFSKSKDNFFIGGFCILYDKINITLCYILNIEIFFPDSYDYFLNEKEEDLLVLVNNEILFYILIIKPLFSIKSGLVNKANSTISHNSIVSCINKNIMNTIWRSFSNNDVYGEIGKFVGTNIDIQLPLKLFFRRSNGIFGKTGTGKTFISRILISYALHNNIASFLIFDMHGEYGHTVISENKTEKIPGLKDIFSHSIILINVSNDASDNKAYDFNLSIPISMITIDDILSLQKELCLHPTACEAAYLLFVKYNKNWLNILIEKENDLLSLSKEIGAHPESISALHRKIKRLSMLSFITKDENNSCIKYVLEALEIGKSVIIQFENINNTLSYLLVSTIFTRLVYNRLCKRKTSLNDKPCIVVIEEAHKFLHPNIANQTPFGMVAREMRKYGMSLLIIDQRPSQIDSEILSQISTKFLLNLSDENDRSAVLSGIENANYVKKLFDSMSFNKNIIITGHAIPFTCLIDTINYNNEFCNQFIKKTNPIEENSLF